MARQQLYEYVGFALFQAGSLLPREAEVELNATVAEILKPMRQAEAPAPSSVDAPRSIAPLSLAPLSARAPRRP